MHSNSGMAGHQTAVFASLLLRLAGLICGVSSSQTCVPQTLQSSQHSVHAYTEQARQCLSGCVGAAKSDINLPEVHVVNARWPSPASPSSTSSSSSSSSATADSEAGQLRVADFHFATAQAVFYARSLVFVLNSATPVRWNVKGEGMTSIPFYTIKIVVPNHSCDYVTWNAEISQSVRRLCSSLPQDNSELLTFVQEQYENVNTFSEVMDANAISLLIGTGVGSKTPATCVLQENFQTPDVTARHIVEQPTIGCQSKDITGPLQPEFHIILLDNVDGAGAAAVPTQGARELQQVTVELQPGSNSDGTCDVVLVLVAEANVTWSLSAKDRGGITQVMSPNLVDMRRDQMYRLERLELPRNIEGLLAWAETEEWPLTTFTRAESANKFVVVLEHKNKPTSDAPKLDFTKMFTQFTCLPDGIQVRILRRVLDLYKLSADNMMLRDHSCKAVESGDDYVIDTQHDECGTTRTEMDTGRVVYHNEVIFTNSESVMEGSGESDLERLMGGLPVDDEQSLTYRVPITCEYSSTGEVLTDDLLTPSKPEITITMHMFTGNNFQQKVAAFPHTVQTGERVYFEVALLGTSHLRIVPSQCWLSSGLKMLTEQILMLIYKGCAREESLIFHRDVTGSGQSTRFSYEVPDIQWDAVYYILCELGVCSDDGTGSDKGVPLCSNIMDPDTGCLVVNKQNGLVVDFPTESIYLGPFKTTAAPINTGNEDPFVSSVSGVRKEPDKVSEPTEECRDEGLGTGPATAIAAASFVMGLVLMAALWFIHTHTGPHTGPPPSASPCTVSTASSPSANGHLMNGTIPNGAIPNGAIPNGVLPNHPVVAVGNGHLPSGFMASKLNPNGIPLQGMRHVDPLPEDV